jgi:hypothetical protein
VLAHYGWDRVAEQTEACYRGVLAGRQPGSVRSGPVAAGRLTDLTAEVAR